MDKSWKFMTEQDLMFEKEIGRVHYWHYHPQTAEKAEFYMVKVVMPVGGAHNFHVHPESHEMLYIIKGTAEQWVENEKKLLNEGDSVYIAANVAHGTFNAADEELHFLAILSPAGGWEAGTIDVGDQEPYASYRSNEIRK